MRIVADVIENIFSSIRMLFLLGFGAIVLIGLFMTFGAGVVAPQVFEAAADRAERMGERALQEQRNRDLAKEGWGYAEPTEGSGATYDKTSEEYVGGWGDDS